MGDYLHLVSFPLAIHHPELVDKIVDFQDTILQIDPSRSGIEKSIFVQPKMVHITVLMLRLWNTDQIQQATEVLESVSYKVNEALENRPVMIRLKGLTCMKGSVSRARVVYAPVEEIGGEGRLLRACKVITEAFVEAGLVMEKDTTQREFKLHATLMNVRFRERADYNKTVRPLDDSFDAQEIFDMYGSEDWGTYRVCEAHLSKRHLIDSVNGYFHCCASIPLPFEEWSDIDVQAHLAGYQLVEDESNQLIGWVENETDYVHQLVEDESDQVIGWVGDESNQLIGWVGDQSNYVPFNHYYVPPPPFLWSPVFI